MNLVRVQRLCSVTVIKRLKKKLAVTCVVWLPKSWKQTCHNAPQLHYSYCWAQLSTTDVPFIYLFIHLFYDMSLNRMKPINQASWFIVLKSYIDLRTKESIEPYENREDHGHRLHFIIKVEVILISGSVCTCSSVHSSDPFCHSHPGSLALSLSLSFILMLTLWPTGLLSVTLWRLAVCN